MSSKITVKEMILQLLEIPLDTYLCKWFYDSEQGVTVMEYLDEGITFVRETGEYVVE